MMMMVMAMGQRSHSNANARRQSRECQSLFPDPELESRFASPSDDTQQLL